MKFIIFLIILSNTMLAQNYGLSWHGYYSGSCDVFIASTNTTYTNKVALCYNLRWSDNDITFDLACNIPLTTPNYIGTGSSIYGILFTFRGNINSHSSINYVKISGNKRHTFTINRNGSTLTGQVYAEKLLTSGGYEYLGTATFNVVLNQTPKYTIWGFAKTPASSGSQPIEGVKMNGTPNNVLTGSDGRYTDQVLYGWSGRITPQKSGYTFSPAYKEHSTPVTTNMAGPDFFGTPITDIDNIEKDFFSFNLFQNYPNPFNPKTVIQYDVAKRTFITLKVYDLLGNYITTLVDEEQTKGEYKIEFVATNLPSGIYIYILNAGDYIDTKKMILLK